MIVLGIHGRVGSGKDEITKHLVAKYGFLRRGFADALKHELLERLRETVKIITCNDEMLGNLPNLPDELRWHLDRERDETWWERRLYYAIWTVRSAAIRKLEQEYGTEVRRRDRFDYWVDAWQERWQGEAPSDLVVPDTRFPNESARIRSLGGYLIRVLRDCPECTPAQACLPHRHISENALVGWTDWDATFYNNNTISDLLAQVDAWMLHITNARTVHRR